LAALAALSANRLEAASSADYLEQVADHQERGSGARDESHDSSDGAGQP
jgi:hypothetical protein